MIFVFEGPLNLAVHETLEAAAGSVEGYDVLNDEYVFIRDDGALLKAVVHEYDVTLSPSAEVDLPGLIARLRLYLVEVSRDIDVALADDPPALARVLFEQERAFQARSGLFSRWLRRRTC